MDCFGYLGLLYSGHMARTRGCMSSSHIYARKNVEKERLPGISQTLPDSGGGLVCAGNPCDERNALFGATTDRRTCVGHIDRRTEHLK